MFILLVLTSLAIAPDPDGVVATAPRGADSVIVGAVAPTSDARPDASLIAPTAQSLTTAQQIDRWIGARTASDAPFKSDREPLDDRKMHGYVSAGIGTGDFSAVSAGVSLPIGESGRLNLSVSQSRNGYGAYGYGFPGYGYDQFGYRGFRPADAYGYRPLSYAPFFEERVRVAGRDLYGDEDRSEKPPAAALD